MDHSKETRVVAYCIEETLANFMILYEFAKVLPANCSAPEIAIEARLIFAKVLICQSFTLHGTPTDILVGIKSF